MQIVHLEYQLDDSISVQRILRLKVGAEDVARFIDAAAAQIQKDVAVPGFRRGRGPLWLVRKQYSKQVKARAFEEIKRASLDQVMKQLQDQDKPFLPPEVDDNEGTAITYGQPLEFTVKYLVDPSGIAKNPEQPNQGFNPLGSIESRSDTNRPMGVPAGPKLPSVPASVDRLVATTPPEHQEV